MNAVPFFRRAGVQAAPWLVPILILIAWELAARTGGLSSRVLPEPLAVVKAAWELIQSGDMWANVKVSASPGFTVEAWRFRASSAPRTSTKPRASTAR